MSFSVEKRFYVVEAYDLPLCASALMIPLELQHLLLFVGQIILCIYCIRFHFAVYSSIACV